MEKSCNFAAETVVTEKTDTTGLALLPAKVNLTDVKAQKTLATKHEVPAKEASTFVIDNFNTTAPGLELKFETITSNLEIRRKAYNRIMRIAEMRLVPIKGDE